MKIQLSKIAAILTLLCVTAFAQSTFTDPRDGKTYKTVKIGKQTWMAENLNYNVSSSKCYDNRESSCKKYGRLYDWNMAIKACPNGWHLPSDAEWQELCDFAGEIAGKKLKAKNGWDDNEGKSGNGMDIYGFSALPGGGGYYDGGFDHVGKGGNWWSTREHNASIAYFRSIYGAYVDMYDCPKGGLFSVRCVKD